MPEEGAVPCPVTRWWSEYLAEREAAVNKTGEKDDEGLSEL